MTKTEITGTVPTPEGDMTYTTDQESIDYAKSIGIDLVDEIRKAVENSIEDDKDKEP